MSGMEGRARSLLAARYLASYLRNSHPGKDVAVYVAAQMVRILIILALPSIWAQRALAQLAARSARRRVDDRG